MRESQKGVRHRQRKTEADSMPEDYRADLLQIAHTDNWIKGLIRTSGQPKYIW